MNTIFSGISAQIYFSRSAKKVTGSLEQEYLALMPPETRAAISCYKRWQDRQANLFGKVLLLRALMLQFPDIGLQKFQALGVAQKGKPFIESGPDFSISHSEELVVLAVTHHGDVGIDIERIRTVTIADFSASLPEVAGLEGINDNERTNTLFFDCWTQKEAVLKGCGEGMLVPMVHVTLKGNSALFNETIWYLKKLLIDEEYCCHVATGQPLDHITVEHVDLMNGVPY